MSLLIKALRTTWLSSPTWPRFIATQIYPVYDRRYYRYYNRSHRQQTRSYFASCLALSLPFLSVCTRRNETDCDGDNDTSRKNNSNLFPTVTCAADTSSERRAALKYFNIFAEVVEEVSPAVVSITAVGHLFRSHTSAGSGFIVDDTGLVVTNAHVVGFKQPLKISTPDGQEFDARVLALDMNSDLALIQVQADSQTLKKLPFLPMASEEEITRPGDFVIALGSPLSLSNTVTVGVISAVDRDLGHRNGLKYIQTDAIITFGNSGGPLVSLYGKAIGVNTMMAGTGLSFAIPIDQVQRFVATAKEALVSEGSHRSKSLHWFGKDDNEKSVEMRNGVGVIVDSKERQTGYLGLIMRTLTPDLVSEFVKRGHLRGINTSLYTGVFIQGVIRDSPAERAGIRPADVIIAINGTKIINANEVAKAIEKQETVSMTVLRNGKEVEISDVRPE